MSDQVTWQDYGPAEFDRRRMPEGHKTAPEGQAGLFVMAAEPKPAKSAALPAELPGQLDIFGGEA